MIVGNVRHYSPSDRASHSRRLGIFTKCHSFSYEFVQLCLSPHEEIMLDLICDMRLWLFSGYVLYTGEITEEVKVSILFGRVDHLCCLK